MGCVENLLIDKVLNGTRRCALPKEELMLQLGGLEGTLEIHGILFGQINLIKSDMKKWRITLEVNTSEGKEKTRENQYNQSEQKAFTKRFLLWKIVYSCTESNRISISHMDISLRSSFTAEITSLSFVKFAGGGNPKKECVVTHIDEWFAVFWHSKEVFSI